MTIMEAVCRADELRPNDLPLETKLSWLSGLEGQLACVTGRSVPAPFGPETALCETALAVAHPWDELYEAYLVMRIDLALGELERYNNDALWYNRLVRGYQSDDAHRRLPQTVTALKF